MSSLLKFGWKALTALALTAGTLTAQAGPSVGVSVQISQPGVYGRIDIGQHPQPEVIVRRPVMVQPAPRPRHAEPVYLWVPPGHQRNWRRHCREYGACGVPVYFVQDRWYQTHVMPRSGDHDRRDEYDRTGRRDDNDRGGDRSDDRRSDHRDPRYGDSRRDDRREDWRDGDSRRHHNGH